MLLQVISQIRSNLPPLPVQPTVGHSLHGVKVAVRPVDPPIGDIQSNSCRSAESHLHQLQAITAIHEGTFQLHLLSAGAHVCEEHVAADTDKVQTDGT